MRSRNVTGSHAAVFVIGGELYTLVPRDTVAEAREVAEKVSLIDPGSARIAGVATVCNTAHLQRVLAGPRLDHLLTKVPSAQASAWQGLVTEWHDGVGRGWIVDREGQSWRVTLEQVISETQPAVGALVGFAGSPHPANGHSHPLARSVRVFTPGHVPA